MLTEIAISAAGSAIGSEIAGSLIEKATEELDQLAENVSIRFSNVGQDLIAQLQNSIEELVKQIGDDLDKLVSELTDTLKVQLHNLLITLEKLVSATINDVNDLTDDLVRDVRATLAKTWFMSEIYALDNIDGTLIPSSIKNDWVIKASGLNVGFDSEDIESVVKLKVKFPNSPAYEVTGAELSAHSVEFPVPIELINEHRKMNSTTIIDAELKVRIKKDGLLWFDKKFEGTQSFKITLAPYICGELFVRALIPTNGWVRRPELDVTYSNALPSGHATSSSKVVHHRITRYFGLPRVSFPPKFGDRRFYDAEQGACTGGGCSHLHECTVKVINNGSTLDVYTYNNSHAITVRIKGKVEHYEKTGETSSEIEPIKIRDNEVLEITAPQILETLLLTGNDLDYGQINLVAKCKPELQIYPMPSGTFGGLEFLGSHLEGSNVIYRFSRK